MLIVKRHSNLISMKDGNNMTALQHLATNPSTFSKSKPRLFKGLIYHYIIGFFHSTEKQSPYTKDRIIE